jgi:hypothetical protein
MKNLLFILLLTSGSAKAQWIFPTFTNIGDTSFFHIEPNEETALLGFKNMLTINGYDFDKKAYTPKDQIMYVIYDVRPSDPEHVYLFYLLRTRKGYEAWYDYRTNQDCVINKEELIITYEREK